MDSNLAIHKISDTEYQVGPVNLKLIHNNISFSAPKETVTLELAQKCYEVHMIFREYINAPVNVLIDLNNAKKSPPEARRFWEKIANEEHYHKIAFCGLHPVARILAAFEISASANRNKMHFFKTKEEAIKWLQE